MKAELAEAKAQKASLEERIKKLHSIRMELELLFDSEKTSLLKQQEQDRETVRLNNENIINCLHICNVNNWQTRFLCVLSQ
jgi:hypothetical protein